MNIKNKIENLLERVEGPRHKFADPTIEFERAMEKGGIKIISQKGKMGITDYIVVVKGMKLKVNAQPTS